jgi:prefoldin subunit 5
MDPSGVLLALDEQKKWRERRERIRNRIKQLQRRKAYLQKELDRVRRKVAEYNALLSGLKSAKLEGERRIPPAALR